ncbi:putative ABC transporter ATP-binding protein YbhF [Ruminiclostridium hungatei]|uniref:Putative ABC transporter ATP-binding protein YbhF n=1 Tax=Ruminiclostridium hungatei TaxID=48256 RepID=A0A1V4SS56_RUMHU|nr:ABC transporter ATP-binding protein [Ruminiclostridium hungatei]OPX46286.1 putative ABC transporter ATP-binding protein YbhF [Ruminiclostridium hungatei]
MNAIEVTGLSKHYGNSRGIIDVNLEVKEGEVFGFIGPNGAGKSTTIRTLLNLIHAEKGEARIFGLDCFAQSRKIKEQVGYLPSEVHYYDDMKVRELLKYSSGYYKKDCSERIDQLCTALELNVDKKLEELSFGNKKKVGIVQALLHQPRLLILDEPTSGLDPLMQNKFFEILREENRKGVTIFFSSHILTEVQRMCDRVAIIKEGRILKTESIDTLRSTTYKRIKIEFVKLENTAFEGFPGVVDRTDSENGMEFLYNGPIEAIVKKLYEYELRNLWVEEPQLEEIFMHYYQ